MLGKTEKPLLVLLAAVAFVLLIACANVANLCWRALLHARERSQFVFSLGATPARVARQLLTESVLLSFIGAVVGVGLAAARHSHARQVCRSPASCAWKK